MIAWLRHIRHADLRCFPGLLSLQQNINCPQRDQQWSGRPGLWLRRMSETFSHLKSVDEIFFREGWYVIMLDVKNVFRSQKCQRNIFLRRLVRDHVGYQKRFQISKVSTKCFFEKAGSSFAMSQQLSLLAQRRTHSDSNVESFEKAQRLNP